MNTINRNYYPVSGTSAQDAPAQTDQLQLQGQGIKPGHNSNLIDFGLTQQANGPHSSLNTLGSRVQPTDTSTSSNMLGGNGEQVLNKLVQAIRNILNNLLSLLEGNLHNGSGPAQTQREQTPTLAQSPSPSSSSSSPSTPQGNAEKPFVVQNDHPSEKPVSLQKNTEPTPAAPPQTAARTAERSSVTPDKTPARPDAVNPAVVNDPALPKTSTDTTKTDNTVKAAKTVTPAAHGQGADMSGIVGFAKEANTTGGNGGEVVTVNTVADLKKYMEDDKARTVKLGANLSADSKVTINFGANKTLLGTDKGNSLHNIYLASGKTASNDIFQNLNFDHDSRYRENGDMQMFISSGQKYWIDHNTYSGTKDQNPKGLDKLLYVGGKADNVSLTNSKFQNNEYGVILGQPDDSAQAKAEYKGYPRMTIANNVFSNLDVRAPGLMRHGLFHAYNNSIDNFHLGFTATGDATILSQANYFAKGVDVSDKASNSGVLDDYGDAHFKDIGSNVSFTQKSAVTAWTPSYQSNIKTAEAARAYDLAHAGANTVN
ncbi:pectate lyase family protein [Pseudomonas syringae]|uniref:Pectin lyase n=2 Tax=Pseudomonas syringae TaxID=317 RepID=A0AB38C0P4_PSESX|nr:type III helper protein HopAK1 [Pseudomonas syringae]KPZ01937.1 Type III helper protein HopAK1 [Pseudomonas syringae pv. aptata]MBI6670816.1 type III helper protein HopAK1 [Pseudomonas syringae]MCK0550110.1 type III helper protein HopAK1 [Pseudomonas syringae pv. aptata]MDP5166581.1 type III helper protein HopAK1 [Pseudomonas syringae pv. aptata str. DSM 50252]NAO53324.1 type III helper protein HopAK1 [Pseudomonas syringae]